jgi:ubiquinone/menaquinone biosynthesis C-methylase UbiE
MQVYSESRTKNTMPEPLQIHKALADETRLRLMRLLGRSPLNVNEILSILQMGQSRISRHLRILAEADLVTRRREGTWIYYESHADSNWPLVKDTLSLLSDHERELPGYENDLQRLEEAIEGRRQQTISFFDSLTDHNEAGERQSPDGQTYREITLSLLPEQIDRVLDLGTGSGLMLPSLLERAKKVVAVDASQTMLQLARQTAGKAAVDRCEFRLGDLEHLPVADGEVDAVIACMVLHHVPRPQAAIAEAWRALAPGGEFTVVDLAQHHDESMREAHADLWLGFRPTEMRRWLTQAGFEVEEGEPTTVETSKPTLPLITFRGTKACSKQPPAKRRSGTGKKATTAKPAKRTTK